jgi:hypothetical protein
MQHPIHNLTAEGCDMLCERLTDFVVAHEGLYHDDQRDQGPVMERCLRILPTDLYNELQGYLGAMRDHISAVSSLLYGDPVLLANEGLIAIPADVQDHAVALAEMILASTTSVSDDSFGHYFAQLDRGVITASEFEALIAVYWDQRGLADSSDVERCDWLYDHGQMDAGAYWEALEEAWTEHIIGGCESPFDCPLHECDSAEQFRNAHITARFPQMTGAPALGGEEGIG